MRAARGYAASRCLPGRWAQWEPNFVAALRRRDMRHEVPSEEGFRTSGRDQANIL